MQKGPGSVLSISIFLKNEQAASDMIGHYMRPWRATANPCRLYWPWQTKDVTQYKAGMCSFMPELALWLCFLQCCPSMLGKNKNGIICRRMKTVKYRARSSHWHGLNISNTWLMWTFSFAPVLHYLKGNVFEKYTLITSCNILKVKLRLLTSSQQCTPKALLLRWHGIAT